MTTYEQVHDAIMRELEFRRQVREKDTQEE
jgi:hypothetical protein